VKTYYVKKVVHTINNKEKKTSLKKLFKLVLKAIAIIIAALIVLLSVAILFIPVHEKGHALTCQVFGVKIIKIEWAQITYEPNPDERVNAIINYSGGLFAALCLALTYILVSKAMPWITNRITREKKKACYFALILKTAILTDLMVEFTSGLLEGTNMDLYKQMASNIPVILSIILSFFVISIVIQGRKYLHITKVSEKIQNE
jgi:hypothetical protein